VFDFALPLSSKKRWKSALFIIHGGEWFQSNTLCYRTWHHANSHFFFCL